MLSNSMEFFREELRRIFGMSMLKRTFLITWLFVSLGLVFLLFFFTLAGFFSKGNYFYFFFHNAGMYLFLIALLLSFMGVYVLTEPDAGSTGGMRGAVGVVFGNVHVVIGSTLGALSLFLLIVIIQAGIGAIGLVPFAGAALIAVMTVPLFFINFFCLLMIICTFFLIPPVSVGARGFRDIVFKLRTTIRVNGANIVLYVIASVSILTLVMIILYLISRYTIGMTQAIQWKIKMAYPNVFTGNVSVNSVLADMITRITPGPDSTAALAGRDFWVISFKDMLQYIIVFSYTVLFSFILSFPLAAYFNLSSTLYRCVFRNEGPGNIVQ